MIYSKATGSNCLLEAASCAAVSSAIRGDPPAPSVRSGNGIEVKVQGGWLSIVAPSMGTPLALRANEAKDNLIAVFPEELASMTPSLPGQIKWALSGSRGCRLQVELPATRLSELEPMRGFALAEFKAVLERIPRGLHEIAVPAGEPPLDGLPGIDALGSLCEEAGWSATVCEGGFLKVDLGLEGSPQSAHVIVLPGSIRICAELCQLNNHPTAAQRALALLLLRANASLFWVRGGFFNSADVRSAGFEIGFAAMPEAAECGRALGALAVACQLCRGEAAALADAEIASRYMEVGMEGNSEQSATGERTTIT